MKVKIFNISNNSSSVLINESILINIGKETINTLLKEGEDLNKIDTIILTNDNYILDYPILLVDLDELGIKHQINVYLAKETKEKLTSLIHRVYDTYFDAFINEYLIFNEIYDKSLISINEDNIKFIKTNPGNYGLIINEKLGFTGTSGICEEIKEIFRKSDLVLMECSQLEGNVTHLGVDDLVVLHSEFSGVQLLPLNITEEIIEEIKKLNLNNVKLIDSKYTFVLN